MSIARLVRRASPRTWFFFKYLRYKYYNGEPEIHAVRQILRKGRLAIDVGCSIGLYSRELAKYAARVIAFEANPRVAEFARLVAPSNVEVRSVALSSANGDATLRIPLNRRKHEIDALATIEPRNLLQKGASVAEKVPTRRLDDHDFCDCDFIKIDVEGHEEAVLEGATHLIDVQRPVIMIELSDHFNPGIIERVTGALKERCYTAYEFSRGRLHPAHDLASKIHSHAAYSFIFIPDGVELPLRRTP